MEKCIFCQIVSKNIPAKIVYEDNYTVGFLDILPRCKGMCIVCSKSHFESFDQNFELAKKCMESSLIVAKKIKNALKPLDVYFSILKSNVSHFHIRIYPIFENLIPLVESRPIEIDEKELNEIAEKIKMQAIIEKKEEVKERKEEEIKISEEDLDWLRKRFLRF